MASYFQFQFLFEPNTLDTVGTVTPRWTNYVGTREGVTADDENALGWIDCTSPAWFTIVDQNDQIEAWLAGELYINDTGPKNGFTFSDSVILTSTAAFLALGEQTALRARIRTELSASNLYGPTTGQARAFDAVDYGYASADFTYADLHGNVWKVADLRVSSEIFSYLFVSASEATSG